MSDLIETYDSLKEIASHLYCIDGDWQKTPLRRRMTLIRLKSGGLVIHNAIRLKEEDYSQLDALGPVRFVLVPNSLHSSEAHYYKLRYPESKLLVSKDAEKAVGGRCTVDGLLPEAWPTELRSEVDCMEFEGTRMIRENVFLHRPTRTLITTDIVMNMQIEVHGLERAFFRFNRLYKRFGPTRIFRYLVVNDRRKAAESFRKFMAWDFDRVIMNHGSILDSGGKEAMQRGFAEMGLADDR